MTQANMGLIGTGTMGSALALNIAETFASNRKEYHLLHHLTKA